MPEENNNKGWSPADNNDESAEKQEIVTPENTFVDNQAPSNTTYQSANAQNTEVVYAKGCVGAAWSDLRKSEKSFSKVLLMGLIAYVPILNWFNNGYAMRWSRELIFDKVDDLKGSIFGERCFVNGAMYFLLTLVVNLVSCILASFCGWIPLIGFILAIAVHIFAAMFLNLMILRTAIFDEIGPGFELGKIFSAGGKKLGSLFCIAFVPALLTGLVAFAICGVILLICGLALGVNLFGVIGDFAQTAQVYGGFASALGTSSQFALSFWAQVLQVLFSILPGLILCLYVSNCCRAVSTLVGYRATGHFVARYCTEWKDDPRFAAQAREI